MEIDEANELIIREAIRRLGPKAGLDLTLLQEKIAEVVKEQGEAIFSQLSEEDRQQLRREGLRINDLTARLGRINEAIEYGRSLVTKYKVETLGELPEVEQQEFVRRYMNATGGAKLREN
jgi:nucleoside-triphosphatase THEP1